MSNGGWGIYDHAFLGDHFESCHVASNATGGYKTDDPNARHTLVACYGEQDQTNDIRAPSVIIGGNISAGLGNAGALDMAGGQLTSRPQMRAVNAAAAMANVVDGTAWGQIGGHQVGVAASFGVMTRSEAGVVAPTWYLQHGRYNRPGEWTFNEAFADNANALVLHGQKSTQFNVGPVGAKIATPAAILGGVLHTGFTQAPTGGTWPTGAVVWNTRPTRGAALGWRRLIDGTWEAFGG